MDASELTEWEALYTQIEPMPEDRADVRAGVIASQSVAPHMKRGHQPPKPLDYFGWSERSKGPSTATLREKFKVVKAMFDRHRKKK